MSGGWNSMTYKECAEILLNSLQSDIFTKEECDLIIKDSGAIKGETIATRTWNALFNNNILKDNQDGTFSFAPKKEKTVNQKNKSTTQLSISKSHSQYYAQYVEEAIVACINKEPIPNNVKNYNFDQWELDIMNEDAQNIANHIEGSAATYVGRQTSKANCDIIVDGKEIEIKYGKSNGTYSNTTMAYFNQFGLKPFKEYMKEYGVLKYLSQFFGDSVYDNDSPVSTKESSDWRKTHIKEYGEFDKETLEYLDDPKSSFIGHLTYLGNEEYYISHSPLFTLFKYHKREFYTIEKIAKLYIIYRNKFKNLLKKQ